MQRAPFRAREEDRMRFGFTLMACLLGLSGASAKAFPESEAPCPGVYLALNSLYSSVTEHRNIRDIGLAWEQPILGSLSIILRYRYLRLRQDAWNEKERNDNVYASTYPASYRISGFQAALRRYPWEWMPGFYAEALIGYKRISGRENDWSGGPSTGHIGPEGLYLGSEIAAFENDAYESAIGAGYQWKFKRLRITLGLAFGPELLIRNDRAFDGGRESSHDFTGLLRFNHLEAGIAL
jgi:hypothetical protein